MLHKLKNLYRRIIESGSLVYIMLLVLVLVAQLIIPGFLTPHEYK